MDKIKFKNDPEVYVVYGTIQDNGKLILKITNMTGTIKLRKECSEWMQRVGEVNPVVFEHILDNLRKSRDPSR